MKKKIVSFLKRKKCKVIEIGAGTVLFFKEQFYGALEVKAHKNSTKQPLQQDNVDWFNANSYGRFVYQENWDEVKKELEELLK